MNKECMLLHVAQASPACEFRHRPGARTLTQNEKLPNEPILNIAICLKIKGILKVSTFTPKKTNPFFPRAAPKHSEGGSHFYGFLRIFAVFYPFFFEEPISRSFLQFSEEIRTFFLLTRQKPSAFASPRLSAALQDSSFSSGLFEGPNGFISNPVFSKSPSHLRISPRTFPTSSRSCITGYFSRFASAILNNAAAGRSRFFCKC